MALVCTVVLLLSSCAPVFTQAPPAPAPEVNEQPKDIIIANIIASLESGELLYDYATEYMIKWGFPEFDKAKLSWAEQTFLSLYNYEGGFSLLKKDVLPRAAELASMFLDEYYDNIDLTDRAAVTNALISCWVEYSGDPYAVYRLPTEADDYTTDMSGKFGGIGVVVEYNHQNETIMVSEVLMNSPSEEVGLRVGDLVWAVDGRTVEELGYLNAIYYVRGEIGTPVTLTVLRDGEHLDFVIVRREITETSVDYSVTEDGYGYIKVTSFKQNTDEQFIAAVDALLEMGVTGMIFDMRNNLGGYVDTVVNMLSYILPSELAVISYQYKIYAPQTLYTKTDITSDGTECDMVLDMPMVVLCNEYTASAAEIFTSVIRDYRDDGMVDAVTVGTLTYKKGIMQSGRLYSDGSSITLTVAYYNPPSGVNYHGIGITPDVTVEDDENTEEDEQLTEALSRLEALLN